MSEYELYTHRGNLLAGRLVGLVTAGVAGGSLARARALESAAEAISDIRSVDAGMADSEPYRAIAAELAGAFERAGMRPVDGEELRDAHSEWMRNGGKGRGASDGDRHFEDASWYDPERLAFHDACEAVDAVKGRMNNLNYHARLPETADFPKAAFAGAGAVPVAGTVLVGVEPDGALAVSLGGQVPGGAAGGAVLALGDAVAAANAAVARLGGRLVPILATFEEARGPQLGVRYRGHVVSVESAAFPEADAGPSLGELRAAALEEATAAVDFGAAVEDMGGWRHDAPGDEFTRRVFVADADDPDADSVRGTLVVRFDPGSASVSEVRATVRGVEVVQPSAPGTAP